MRSGRVRDAFGPLSGRVQGAFRTHPYDLWLPLPQRVPPTEPRPRGGGESWASERVLDDLEGSKCYFAEFQNQKCAFVKMVLPSTYAFSGSFPQEYSLKVGVI